MTIAAATFRELLGRKVLVWGGLLSMAFLGLYTLGLTLLRREMGLSGIDAIVSSTLAVLALYVVSFLGSFLGLVLSAGSVASEIDNGLIHAVMARPISRPRWLLERWAAISVMVSVYTVAMGWTMMKLAELILVYRPLSVGSTLGLMGLQVVVMVTLGTLLSTRMSAVATGVVLFALFGVAWMGGIIEFLGQNIGNDTMVDAGIVTSLVMPTDALWKAASYYASTPDFLSDFSAFGLPFSAVTPPALPFLAWSVAYVGGMVLIAVRRFVRRDL